MLHKYCLLLSAVVGFSIIGAGAFAADDVELEGRTVGMVFVKKSDTPYEVRRLKEENPGVSLSTRPIWDLLSDWQRESLAGQYSSPDVEGQRETLEFLLKRRYCIYDQAVGFDTHSLYTKAVDILDTYKMFLAEEPAFGG